MKGQVIRVLRQVDLYIQKKISNLKTGYDTPKAIDVDKINTKGLTAIVRQQLFMVTYPSYGLKYYITNFLYTKIRSCLAALLMLLRRIS